MLDASHFRIYRNHISSLYSAKSVDTLESKLLKELENVAERLHSSLKTNKCVNIQKIFRTLSVST